MNREEREAFEHAARALHEGKIGEGQFLAATRERWRRTARYLFEHWRRKLPAWVEEVDVEQELGLLALKHVRDWDPGRGAIGPFVLWSTIHRAQRELNRWRGACLSGNEGRNPSRAEIAFCRAFGPEVDPMAFADPCAATQEQEIDRRERFEEILSACESVREALVLLALRRAEGSLCEAAALLFGDYASRVECELVGEEHTRQVVKESVSKIVARAHKDDEEYARQVVARASA
jgi:hypothetical protein